MGKPDGHGGSSGRWRNINLLWHRKVASPTWRPKRAVDNPPTAKPRRIRQKDEFLWLAVYRLVCYRPAQAFQTGRRPMLENISLEETLVGYYSWNIGQNLIYLDAVAAHLREVSPDKAACGIPVEHFIAQIESGSRARVAKAVYNSLTNGVFYDQEYRIQLKAGGFRWLRTTGRVILDSDRIPIMAMGTVRDVSAGKVLLM
ncbi:MULTISPECIES: PAS domain-containing protein [Rhizobium/Agrobacterium group]|uniref:PAS domain-containing protein n=1 Tax=Rhizobium/Agrobacterium group TaxID=227290 RepID=UPI0025702DC4|nr:PAS domain-containing protein [Rhizobium sp. AU243]